MIFNDNNGMNSSCDYGTFPIQRPNLLDDSIISTVDEWLCESDMKFSSTALANQETGDVLVEDSLAWNNYWRRDSLPLNTSDRRLFVEEIDWLPLANPFSLEPAAEQSVHSSNFDCLGILSDLSSESDLTPVGLSHNNDIPLNFDNITSEDSGSESAVKFIDPALLLIDNFDEITASLDPSTGVLAAAFSENDNNCSQSPTIMLQQAPLWRRLSNNHINEMIITPAGRRIFPYIQLQAFNLDPFRRYRMAMDLIDLDPDRLYRYDKQESRWVARQLSSMVLVPAQPDRHWHWHPAGAQTGADWMRETLEFADIRVMSHLNDPRRPAAMNLFASSSSSSAVAAAAAVKSMFTQRSIGSGGSNRSTTNINATNKFQVQTGHLYLPRFHLVDVEADVDVFGSSCNSSETRKVWSFSFDCMQFIATTHYQSRYICHVKAQYNKHITRNTRLQINPGTIIDVHQQLPTDQLGEDQLMPPTHVNQHFLPATQLN